MSSLSDGGRIGSTGLRIFSRRTQAPYLVRMIEPNPITSHDWHVQPICQRSLRVVRLSGTPWIEARTCVQGHVLELDAHRLIFPLARRTSAFLREPFKVIKVPVAGQGKNRPEPLWITRLALRKKSKSGQQKSLEPIGLAGDQLPGHAMACSLWDSLQGFNGAHRAQLVRPYEPASHFPNRSKITDLRSGRPHGHREAPLLTTSFVRVAQATQRCKHCGPTFSQRLQQRED